jgi:cytoskeletal protein RodZ
VAKTRERRRQLARLKYERQSVRRSAQRERQRKLSIVGGVAVAVLGVIGLVWLIVHLASDESTPPTNPAPSFTLPPNTLVTPAEPTPSQPTTKSAPTKSATPSHSKPSKPSKPSNSQASR